MNQAKIGDTVTVNYTLRLEDGSVFDTTEAQRPVQFVVGGGQVLNGFEQAVLGMSPGEDKSVTLPPAEGFGLRREDLVAIVDRDRLPATLDPQVGQTLKLPQQDGSSTAARIVEVTESKVTVDANHPLAGRTLCFDIALLEVA